MTTFGWFGKAGDQTPLLALSGGVLALGLVGRNAGLARTGARMIAAHLLATGVKSFMKHRLDRKRPRNADGPADNALSPGGSRAKAKSSFPSGHSAGAMAVARAVGRDYPAYRQAAVAGAVLVGVAQIPRATHFVTDVVAGLATGWAAEAVVSYAWDAATRAVTPR